MTPKTSSETQVKDLMSSHVVSLHASATIHEALQMIVENRVSALPVVDDQNRCVGIITTTDLIHITYDIDDDFTRAKTLDSSSQRRMLERLGNTIGNEPVSSFSSEKVCTASQSSSLKTAARKMLQNQVHHLPIVNEDDQLVGILSTMDILSIYVDDE